MTAIIPLVLGAYTPATRSLRPVGGAAFTVPDGGAAAAPPDSAAVADPREVTGLHLGLLHLQTEPADRDDQGRRRARTLLAGLAALQLRLLDDPDAPPERLLAVLAGLRRDLRDLPRPEDPGLAAALAAVALRVEVEVARRLPD